MILVYIEIPPSGLLVELEQEVVGVYTPIQPIYHFRTT